VHDVRLPPESDLLVFWQGIEDRPTDEGVQLGKFGVKFRLLIYYALLMWLHDFLLRDNSVAGCALRLLRCG
jgi:hypothetical protein